MVVVPGEYEVSIRTYVFVDAEVPGTDPLLHDDIFTKFPVTEKVPFELIITVYELPPESTAVHVPVIFPAVPPALVHVRLVSSVHVMLVDVSEPTVCVSLVEGPQPEG